MCRNLWCLPLYVDLTIKQGTEWHNGVKLLMVSWISSTLVVHGYQDFYTCILNICNFERFERLKHQKSNYIVKDLIKYIKYTIKEEIHTSTPLITDSVISPFSINLFASSVVHIIFFIKKFLWTCRTSRCLLFMMKLQNFVKTLSTQIPKYKFIDSKNWYQICVLSLLTRPKHFIYPCH